jgi:FMN phosphatase YigB (HAD superfamily)
MGDDDGSEAEPAGGRRRTGEASVTAASFDCFGTLVYLPRPPAPADDIADELVARGVGVPDDWDAAYTEPHLDRADGTELSLPNHARAALASRGVDAEQSTVEAAVLDAFDREPELLPGAEASLRAVDAPVGVLSNCSIPGLVPRVLSEVELLDSVDAIVSSVEVGWRKPHRRAFAAVADELGVTVAELVHVGDNREADGGIDDHGGRYLHVDGDLQGLPDRLAETGVVER